MVTDNKIEYPQGIVAAFLCGGDSFTGAGNDS
jgi:hypothetical protein